MSSTELGVIHRDGTRLLYTLQPGEIWRFTEGGVVIVHPDREPKFIDAQGIATEITPMWIKQ